MSRQILNDFIGFAFTFSLPIYTCTKRGDNRNKVLKNVLFLIRDLINQFNIASLIIKQNFISIETKTGKSVFMLHHDNSDRLV